MMEFKIHKKDKDATSIWIFFLIAENANTAKCKLCKLVLKTGGGSTKGLHTHLQTKHNKTVQKRKLPDDEVEIVTPPVKKITHFFSCDKDTLEIVLARMTAKDGLPFSVFITSTDLRNLLISKGFTDLPTSPSTIRNIVMSFGNKIRANMKNELKKLKDSGERFSLSFDEWTSCSNKRYMNVCVYSTKKQWNLGLIRIIESMTSEVCIRTLNQRLEIFGLTLAKDIVAIVTDGPNVMLRVGKSIDVEHHICLAHTMHLAVCDVLYKKIATEALTEICCNDEENTEEDVECLDSGLVFESEHPQELTEEYTIKSVIKKVRTIVLLFKRSPTKNDTVLQKYVQEAHGKELCLLLDCKTRWNSLLTMIERFVLLKSSIQKSLIDIEYNHTLCDADFELLQIIIDVLSPLKLAVEALGRADANLCTADAALKFLFKQLHEKNTALAKKLSHALETRLENRRNQHLSGVLCHLQNPQSEISHYLGIPYLFEKPSKALITKQVTLLVERLHNRSHDNDIEEVQLQEEIEDTSSLSLKQILELEIGESMKSKGNDKVLNLTSLIKSEQKMLEAGKRGYYMELAYQYLLTIPPTSIEPERTFSAAAYLGSKIRSRLNAETLDTLVFLRFYFK